MKTKTKNTIIASLAALIALGLLSYAAAWDFAAKKTHEALENLYKQAAADGVEIKGDFPAVSGFPGAPVILFSGEIDREDDALIIPRLEISGWLLPGRIATLTLPQGASVKGPGIDTAIDSLDSLSLSVVIPSTLPAAGTVEDLRGWRDADGKIDIKSLSLQKGPLQLAGQGSLKLDDALQPAGQINAVVRGHMAFLGWLQQQGRISGKNALITGAVLTGLTVQDPQTGERVIKAAVSLQNSRILVGPLPLFVVPKIVWPYNSRPSLMETQQ